MMTRAALLAAAGAGVAAARRISGVRNTDHPERWLAVTVLRSPEDVRAELPGPLAEFGDRIELRVQPAAADKGTELGARLREPGPHGVTARLTGRDPAQQVRAALRRTKSLLETGEVLQPEPPTTHPGPGGKLVQLASRRAGGEGRL